MNNFIKVEYNNLPKPLFISINNILFFELGDDTIDIKMVNNEKKTLHRVYVDNFDGIHFNLRHLDVESKLSK